MTLATTDPDRGVIRWESHGAMVALTTNYVREYFCKEATPQEALAFMRFCEAHQLNPFLKDAYLVKYNQNESAQIVIAAHTWTKRASIDPQYKGHQMGIIVKTGEGFERRESLFYTPDEEVVGGWAEVYFKDGSSYRTELPIQERIAHKKDGTPTQFWTRMPGTMIAKCALSDCMRNAFPVLFAGAYDQAEIEGTHVALAGGLVIEGTTVDLVTGEIKPYPPEIGQVAPEEADEPLDSGEPDEPLELSADQILDEAIGPSAAGDDPIVRTEWEQLIEDIQAAGMTLAEVLPKGSATIKEFEASGGTAKIARVRFGKVAQ